MLVNNDHCVNILKVKVKIYPDTSFKFRGLKKFYWASENKYLLA